MTREEAKEIMSKVTFYWELGEQTLTQNQINEALDLAIKALEQQPCEDCISRAELLKAINTWDKYGCDANTKLVPYQDHYIPYIHYDDVVKCIKGMPSVTPKTKIGRWLTWKEAGNEIPSETRFECSVCHDTAQTLCNGLDLLSSFCPNCGARMAESEDKTN